MFKDQIPRALPTRKPVLIRSFKPGRRYDLSTAFENSTGTNTLQIAQGRTGRCCAAGDLGILRQPNQAGYAGAIP